MSPSQPALVPSRVSARISTPAARPRPRIVTVAAIGGALLALTACAPAPAHDWVSPSDAPGARGQRAPAGGQDDAVPWAGWIWQGPAHGAPAAPSASGCRRAPATFAIDGPAGSPVWRSERRVPPFGMARLADGRGAAAESAAAAEKHAAAPAVASADRAEAAPRERLFAPRPPHQAAPAAPAPRPADEPVTAGVVDDNADFGAWQAFRSRWSRVPQRELAIDARVLVDVRDAAGRPVPDAAITVYEGGRAVPVWARTDAGGRAWLMPQADAPGRDFEVRVSKGGVTSSALWRRGQKDVLQLRLDGAPATPARLDIVFAIDATGSMADEIDKLKTSMRAVADQIARLPSRPDLCFGLVAYRDRGDEFFVRGADLTDDVGAFQQQLAQLRAGGGGDYPEAMNEALHTAIHRIGWRGEGTARIVILLADAPPQLGYGGPQYHDDARGALARGIKVFGVGASGLDRQGEVVMRQLAQFTGGRFVFLTYDRAHDPSSGPGRETVHDVRNYSVETLDKLLVRLVSEEMARWPAP